MGRETRARERDPHRERRAWRETIDQEEQWRAVCIPHVHGITLCGTRSVLAVDLAPFASDPCVGWELRGLYASHVCRVCARVCASERVCA